MPPCYLIHQPGKVASQTLEQVIRTAAPNARVERHHYLSDERLAYLSSMCRLPGVEADGQRGAAHQLALAAAARQALADVPPDSLWIVTGFRDPLALVISAFFQNLTTYCPWIDFAAPDLVGQAERLSEFFVFQFDRMVSGAPPRSFQDAFLNLKLEGPESWFEAEFRGYYGVDLYSISVGIAPYVVFAHGGRRFCLYRSETLSSALPGILTELGIPPVHVAGGVNIGAEKPYSRLYSVFKERFRPTPEMIRYYYDGRFFRHFYFPLWERLDNARRGIRPDPRDASAAGNALMSRREQSPIS